MILRNKKTGMIGEAGYISTTDGTIIVNNIDDQDEWYDYNSLAELNEEWEDYEEPKTSALDMMILTLTNFIENEPDEDKVDLEDCKQMLDKLKAWQRLKDKGLVIKKWRHTPDMHLTTGSFLKIEGYIPSIMDNIEDLDLLFGGEE